MKPKDTFLTFPSGASPSIFYGRKSPKSSDFVLIWCQPGAYAKFLHFGGTLNRIKTKNHPCEIDANGIDLKIIRSILKGSVKICRGKSGGISAICHTSVKCGIKHHEGKDYFILALSGFGHTLIDVREIPPGSDV